LLICHKEVEMDQLSSDIAKGALAGLAGTAAMTFMMWVVAPRVVPKDMRPTEFIPKSVVESGEKQAGHPNALLGHEKQAGYAAHFAYGAGLGMLYGAARERLPQLPAPVMGALFGVGIWAVNFEKTLPALGIQPRVTEQPMKKRPMPLMAHVIFGTTTALAHQRLH
jgi:putative membrane protein